MKEIATLLTKNSCGAIINQNIYDGVFFMKHCYIFAAGDMLCCPEIDGDSLIIAADAGFKHLEKACVNADIVMGDFDSLENIPENCKILKYPPEKYFTDTELAINTAIDMGCTSFTVIGALGGERFEHTIANLQLACGVAKKGFDITLTDGVTYIDALHCGEKSFDSTYSGFVSVFSFDGDAKGVTLKNLKYELDNVTLPCTGTLGVSNEFTGKDASVCVKDGTVMIIYRRKDN